MSLLPMRRKSKRLVGALVLAAISIFATTPTLTAQADALPAQTAPAQKTPPAPEPPAKPADGKDAPVAADPGQPWCIAYSPDGKSLAMVSGHRTTAGTYLVWDLATQALRFRKSENKGLRCVTYSPDNKILALASYDGSIKLVHPITGKEIAVLRGHKDGVNAVAFSPNGKLLASSSLDRTAKVWDLATKKEKLSLTGHKEYVLSVAFSPDGKLLATGSGTSEHPQTGGEIKLWDADTGKEKTTFENQKMPVECVTFSPDGKSFATLCWDGAIKLWNVETGKEQIAIQQNGAAMAGNFSTDGKVLATASHVGTGEARLWDTTTGRETATLPHSGQVWKVCFSPDGKTLATCAWDGKIRLWELATKQERAVYLVAGNTFDPQGAAPPGPAIKRANVTTKDLDALWTDLAGPDAKKAYQAILTLARSEKEALPYLKDRLLSVKDEKEKPIDAPLIAKLIADLDNDDPDVRDKATDDLKQMGKGIEPALREALKGKASAEVRIRLELLLDKVPGVQGEALRIGRATEALEFTGSPGAKDLLSILAKEAAKPEMKAEAKAALERLAKRPD